MKSFINTYSSGRQAVEVESNCESAHNPGMKYPEKRYVQGVRPAHIVFPEFLVPG